ncbi:DUF397 domain-containing protein [Streptomyces iconiensis]|uniref:DUF397 domain-containing protein n=1 Tax=Streptomyces iconiensis TaxID=1384038 RepID=A0ABT7A8E5_9ACTN|nr:DUF397 domain-containing protein [Streptomyces iconiensis]MDJ1137307.1 DUF397 domain-containing protein [Streptomyces iconiensis]
MNGTVEVPRDIEWFKSSHSNDQGGNCVEGARLHDGAMAVRDSKQQPHGPALTVRPAAWTTFITALKDG